MADPDFTIEQFLDHYFREWDTDKFLGWPEVWICIEQLYIVRIKQLEEERDKLIKILEKYMPQRKKLLQFCISLERGLRRDCYVTFDGVPKPLKNLLDEICGPPKTKAEIDKLSK